ncbi:hydroxymethylpyrimidine pyrophosphatase-like HAD family hydrolase [Mycoplasmoides fastidiosum]|uniref:Hydroxymethylpyrimidine pyrophosphatase-like HAD family hydrolase n=1 Tax=Mycoplasmoides fastidiosum TaxID=92758 RepID=A0ABU0LYG9_9BACT|nr:hypothetical protein [Mycoplasmoides fastidiosum]MDQ0513734.1 hydroxymethylpyrimidine pyrophosphatase-like HAD family hydrolase [Mycoplasmoides fastidiosum]UUD37845.1 hypothetical protein NPA10_00400 [Mycoplasmoides fastidiosum]
MIFDSKLIVFDIDFFHSFDYDLDLLQNMKRLLQKISGEQNLVIMSNENLMDCVDQIKKLKIRSGYIIANSGSFIFNIAADAMMFQKKFDPNTVKAIAHIATLRDLVVIINDLNGRKISYELNDWAYNYCNNKILNEGGGKVEFFRSWNEFLNAINKLVIGSVEIIFHYDKDENIAQIKQDFLSKINLIVKADVFLAKNHLYISPINATRINALYKLAKVLEINPKKDCLYIGVNNYDGRLRKFSYLSVTSQETYRSLTFNFSSLEEPHLFLAYQNSWIGWLNNNDYLWSHEPNHRITDWFFNTQDQLLHRNFDIDELKNTKTKFIQFNTRKRFNRFSKIDLNTHQTDTIIIDSNKNEILALPVWEENKKTLLQKLNTIEQIK